MAEFLAAAAPRVALFGGSFDPPHRGHLAIARAAADAFALDRVLFTPAALQPLKLKGASVPYADRLEMVRLACTVDPRFAASEMDRLRPDGQPNYTVHTLESLGALYPRSAIFAIAGADSFLELRGWFQSKRLLELAEWIVVSRPGFPLDKLSQGKLVSDKQSRVQVLETVQENVSATELRNRLARGEDCLEAVQASVLGYIREHRLYR